MACERDVAEEIFAKGGEMGALMRQFDWSKSPLGSVENWPQSLKSVVRIVLTSRYAMWMGWGPELTFFYNDSYASMTLGKKHPWALGRPASEVWSEIWDEIEPRIHHVLATGEATWDEALQLFLERSGFREETYHTFSYSPLTGEDGTIAGMLCVVTEETERVVGERQLTLLRSLSSELGSSTAETDLFRGIERVLEMDLFDLPFTLTYLVSPGEKTARLACCTGVNAGIPPAPEEIEAHASGTEWPIAQVLRSGASVIVDDLEKRFEKLPRGIWSEPPRRALLVPIATPGQERPAGVFIAALNPFRQMTPAYIGFIDLIAGQIAASLANARAYQEERKRAEALAELDRAKTAFFTNVSHEFRTPLTLMLSPLEETIAKAEANGKFGEQEKAQLDLARRNAMRLLKLVNALLDFSRIEAQRARAVYQPTDLAQFTAELASVFRSATEKAGLTLNIDCAPLSQNVSVDREMWEKIVLNLLSNAFKFTLDGSITVRLTEDRDAVRLEVVDTGTGIPQSDLPHIFERFHQVKGTHGRSIEGTGIGLALVQELIKLHDGSIQVESEYGKGTTFTVTLPKHAAVPHAMEPELKLSPGFTQFRAEDYVEEALRWLPDTKDGAIPRGGRMDEQAELPFKDLPGGRVLLADDNADMREYVRRLLAQHFDVDAVSNGAEALAAAQSNPPDLVLADVMMPELDGLGLLQALRSDPKTSSLPVILLSARAGVEAHVEGLESGADDYLTKPFTAQELLARVRSQLKLARLRLQVAESERVLRDRIQFASDAAGIGYWFSNLPLDKLIWDARLKEQFWLPPDAEVDVDLFYARLHPEDRERVRQAVHHSITNNAIFDEEYRTVSDIGEQKWIRAIGRTAHDTTGRPVRFDGITLDITKERQIEEALRRSEKLAVVGRMASSISHEINNPLESVMNLLYLIQGTAADKESQAYTRTALEELNRVSHIVTHTLQYNRQTDGSARKKISELLDSAAAIYQGRLKSAGIRLEKDYAENALEYSLPLEARQVFSNLIGNAFDATPSGEKIVLRIRRTIDWKTEQEALRITIADTGRGMDQQTLRRIFEPFFTTKGNKGTGLGLWISGDILKRHHARMQVRSRRDEGRNGTVFSMLFPLDGQTRASQIDAVLSGEPAA